MSHILEMPSLAHVAMKSPVWCHVQPHTTCVWSLKVVTQRSSEKSQIFTVESPDVVTSWVPLKDKQTDKQTERQILKGRYYHLKIRILK